MMTDNAILDHMTDYADEFGDQKLLEMIDVWKEHKMGKQANNSRLQIANKLSSVSEKISELKPNPKLFDQDSTKLAYEIAKTDCLLIILKETAEL